MNVVCWRCGLSLADPSGPCRACQGGQIPTACQVKELEGHIDFLLAELDRWPLSTEQRSQLMDHYHKRRQLAKDSLAPQTPPLRTPANAPPDLLPLTDFSKDATDQALADQPPIHETIASTTKSEEDTDFLFEYDEVVPSPAVTDKVTATTSMAPEPYLRVQVPSPGIADAKGKNNTIEDFNQVLAERNIRWIHMLGGLLFVSAFIGFLKANWDGYGKTIAALAMVFSPAFFFTLASWLRERLPQSSRLMSVVGGILLPTGLIALNHFHIFGVDFPTRIWNPLSFGISSAVLFWQAYRLNERACLYLAALTYYLGALTSGSSLLLAIASFGGAGIALYYETLFEEDQRTPLHRVSQALALAGLGGGFLRGVTSWQSASSIFLIGSLYFAAQGFLAHSKLSLVLSTLTGLLGGWACKEMFHFSGPVLGLISLVQGSLFVARGKRLIDGECPEARMIGAFSCWLGVTFCAITLGINCGWLLLNGFWNHFADYTVAEQWSCIWTGILAALYFAAASVVLGQPRLVYASASCGAYAYFVAIVMVKSISPERYPILTMLLPIAWQSICLILRSRIPHQYLTPWILSGTALAALIAPVQILFQLTHPTPWDGLCYLSFAGCCILTAWWQQDRQLLFPAATGLVLAYSTQLPLLTSWTRSTNVGLCYLPFTALLIFLARQLCSQDTQQCRDEPLNYGEPLLHCAVIVVLVASLSQGYYYSEDSAMAALSLALYGVCAAFIGWRLPTTRLSGIPHWQIGLMVAGVNWLATPALLCNFSETGCLLSWLFSLVWLVLVCNRDPDFGVLRWVSLGWSVFLLIVSLASTATPPIGHAFQPLTALVWSLPLLLEQIQRHKQDSPGGDQNLHCAAMGGTIPMFLLLAQVDPLRDSMACLLVSAGFLWLSWKSARFELFYLALLSTAVSLLTRGLPIDPAWLPAAWLVSVLIFTRYAGQAAKAHPNQSTSMEVAAGLYVVTAVGHAIWGGRSSCIYLAIYSAWIGYLGCRQLSLKYLLVGSALLSFTIIKLGVLDQWTGALLSQALTLAALPYLTFGFLALPGLQAGQDSAVEQALGQTEGSSNSWTILDKYASISSRFLTIPGLLIAFSCHDYQVSLLLAASYWAGRAYLDYRKTSANFVSAYHVVFLCCYAYWVRAIAVPSGGPHTLELLTVPPGIWLVYAASRQPPSSDTPLGPAGLLMMLLPCTLFSASMDMSHILWGFGLSLTLLALGALRQWPAALRAGSYGLMAQIGLQAVSAATKVPWYVTTVGVGIAVIAIGFMLEMNRVYLGDKKGKVEPQAEVEALEQEPQR